jgi:TonB family protein
MMRARLRTLLLLCFVSTRAAAQAPAAPGQELPSVTLPADLDRVLRDYERAWKAGDAPALASLFSPDGFVLQNGRAPVRGRAAIARAYAGQGGGALRLRALGYATADTVGYIVGAYSYGDTPGDMGKYTLTLRRPRGGAWEIYSDMDNGSAPRRPAPSSAPSSPPSADMPYFEYQVERQVRIAPGSPSPRYPEALKAANVEGEALVQFVVDTTGRAEMATFKVLKSSHYDFTEAVRSALPEMRFTSAENGGRKVRQLVQHPFTFALSR